jgi:hypothetical protein
MVLNAKYVSYIMAVISWQLVLLVEKTWRNH